MSHQATNWAILQRGLKPTTKIVLWHLCDRHNPDFGCFPTQVRLAADAEMSVSSLNDHLAKLEEAGLIRRHRSHDPRTHRRLATRYILGFEMGTPENPAPEAGDDDAGPEGGEPADPCPKSGHGAISEKSAKPSPKNAGFHLRNSETNPVREPLREPVKEAGRAGAPVDLSDEFFSALLEALGHDPAGALPDWWQGWPAREHVRRWRDDLGLTEEQILSIASATRTRHPIPPDGPKALDRAMERAARRKGQPDGRKQSAASHEEIIGFYADWINSDRYLVPNSISTAIRNAMLARGLVTEDRLRERGVL